MLKSSQAAFESAGGTQRKVATSVHKSLLAASLLVSSLCYSTLASALGLGDITLHSALNQPLDAEIALLETGGLGPEDVVAKLASAEAFAKADVERSFFLNDLRFTPVIRGNRGVIRVVSSKPVTEPYLNFMVQLARPNGDQLRTYTLLLDPATTPEGQAAIRSRKQERAAQPAPETRMPVAPPAAREGKRYTVAEGDTLNGIARQVQDPKGKVSASQLAEGIRALNPQTFASGANAALKVGQVLLLPDAAVLPTGAAAAPVAKTASTDTQAAEAQRTADQLAAAAIESQQLNRAVEDLKVTTQELQAQLAGKDKQITALRTELAQVQARPAANPAVAPAAPVPVAAQPVQSDSFISWPLLLGAVVIVLLLLAFAYSKRRHQARKKDLEPIVVPEEPLIKPAQSTILPVFEVPTIAEPQPVEAPAPVIKAPVSPRLAGAAPDALDGVSIYIAYGRFSEALGILRDALVKQPEREDIRIRMLELLAEQGDVAGFAKEEEAALRHGVDAEKIQEIHARYPQMKVSEPPAVTAAVIAAVAAPLILEKPSQPEAPAAQLDETTAAALNPEQIDEFQLNLDDLSMDANWDLVDPFDAPPTRSKAATPAEPAAPEVDPAFASNLTQLPEVFELPEDQFLSDYAEPEVIEPIEVIEPADSDALSDEFLDSFMDDDSEFDLLDLDEAPLTRINEAQVLIDEGDTEAAREILLQVIEESDEQHKQMARELLAGIS
ncbi:FimV/HubP family polar landmark protein [Pseudomonas lijiangensis]|uniref:LysM peptidoglycan-binding domain-containing protein n=1 Tax=Pseudomonas lijiangensis TaxID=2995658 RepID=A0ABX8HMK0_9PSED|nr:MULTISPECIES: FimV/HubP family polar landmark protein [Pseudomonas syringae group]MBX8489850.1 LysM peptidoglycan-binding domain-containing protein [Pseudomonas cichorii]MBX8499801.1 LysM peptidoglycan-binding domain-containing protein [Pseudomonas lijiangensis]MBX8503946.1 LysM peptidoglycan-binding domain-containing protein [Pseudomonas lijiangensis]QWU81674.1 LysM peptidoglycan-binding domain-containing protein [Pseudomonas lijiangensis]